MNIDQIEAAFLARLPTVPGFPAGVALYGTTDDIDWTDANAPNICGQLRFTRFEPSDQFSGAAAVNARWAFDVYFNHARATPAERTAAVTLIQAALQAATGWQYAPARVAEIAAPDPSAFDRQHGRLSLAFTTPLFAQGID